MEIILRKKVSEEEWENVYSSTFYLLNDTPLQPFQFKILSCTCIQIFLIQQTANIDTLWKVTRVAIKHKHTAFTTKETIVLFLFWMVTFQ
jgi:hypothetical protein